MKGQAVLLALYVLLLTATSVQSVKIGYHGIDVSEMSEPLALTGVPANGSFLFTSHIAVPFRDHDGGKGAVGIIPAGSDVLTSLVRGFDEMSPIPRELFWDADVDGDPSHDLVLTDHLGRLYVLGSSFPEKELLLSPEDAVLTGMNGTLDLADVSGDGMADLLVLEEDGSGLRAVLGPLTSPSGSFSIELPFECHILASGLDITGDGLSEIALIGNDGGLNDSLIAYDGSSLSLIASIPLKGKAAAMDHGDIDGDGIDDIMVLFPGPSDEGSISVMFGKGVKGTSIGDELVWSIVSDITAPVHGDLIISVIDLDGDRSDDIIIADPFWNGRGKVSLFYGGSEVDHSTDRSYSFPDADLRGSSPGSHLSPLIISSLDHDGDFLPDIFLKNGSSLLRWSLPSNSPPDDPMVLRFTDPGSERTKERAQAGETVGIRMTATGGGTSFHDIARVDIRSSDITGPRSWTLLKETGPDTSLYTATFQLLEGTIEGRSISVRQGDDLVLEYGGLSSQPLKVHGRVGQDDPPYFDPIEYDTTAVEGKALRLELRAYDPEDDTIEWNVSDLPSWLGFDEGTLSGTPSDGDVGTYDIEVNVSANGKNASQNLTITVMNMPPSIATISLPSSVREGVSYTGLLGTDGQLDPLNFTGPSDLPWLELHPNGSLSGFPRNVDVGSWDFNATARDLHGSISCLEWSVSVENAPPVLDVPYVPPQNEGTSLTLDLDELNEGDGLTMFFVQGAPEGMTVNRTTGNVTYAIPQGSGNITFRAGVTDGHGASDRVDVQIEVVRSHRPFLNDLPDVLMAGEMYLFDLDAAGEGVPERMYAIGPDLPFFNAPDDTFRSSGKFAARPWNMDAGSYRVNISFGSEGEMTYQTWTFLVVGNLSLKDPSISISSEGQKGDELHIRVTTYNGSLHAAGAGLALFTRDGATVVRTFELTPPFDGRHSLDVSGLEGEFLVKADMVLNNTELGTRGVGSTYLTVDLALSEGGVGGISIGLMLIPVAIALIVILSLSAVLLGIERTSYGLQTLFASGSSRNDEVVLSAVQRRPGVRFRELQEQMTLSRRELVSGLMSLTSNGHIRAVTDGTAVRFLPTVGSFVSGPLAIDRTQGLILDILKGGGEMTADEISKRSGLPTGRVNRELSLLSLKDAVSARGKGLERRFYLTGRQRARLSSWARSGRIKEGP